MDNFLFYKRIKDRDIYFKVIYDYCVNLCGNKCLPSQLKITISGLNNDYKEGDRLGHKDFCIDRDDWASKNNIDSSQSDEELKIAEDYFVNNKNVEELKKNSVIFYLLSEVDNFLEKYE